MKVVVIKTFKMDEVKSLFEDMGLSFVEEKHGNGPEHYACEINGKVLEIYPAGRNGPETVLFLEDD